MRSLRSLTPHSLLVRTFLLIAILMLLSLGAWMTIFFRLDRAPHAQQMAQTLVSVANLTRTALITAHPQLRRVLLQELSDKEGIHIYPAEEDDILSAEPLPPFIEDAAKLVRKELGESTRVALELNGEHALFVTFRLGDDDEYWVALPRERIDRQRSQQWLWWSVAATLLAIIGAWLVMSRVTKPLKALTAAAQEVGRGKTPAPLEEDGPTELATVSKAFNQMSADVERMNADRALVLAGISHDLRTPLTRLRMSVEMSGADELSRSDMVADIEEIDQTIGQFLDFARTDEGEAFVDTDLTQLVNEIREHYARIGLDISGVTVEANCAARPKALRRAVMNLIENARKYGIPPIRLNLAQTAGMICLQVSDCGPGIPEGQAERLKQPFTRLEEARTNTAGAGLGLAIVERVARAHHGTLVLESLPQGGFSASLHLPD